MGPGVPKSESDWSVRGGQGLLLMMFVVGECPSHGSSMTSLGSFFDGPPP